MGGVCPWVSSALYPVAVLAQSLVDARSRTDLVQGGVEEGGSVPLLLVPVSVSQRGVTQVRNAEFKSCL